MNTGKDKPLDIDTIFLRVPASKKLALQLEALHARKTLTTVCLEKLFDKTKQQPISN